MSKVFLCSSIFIAIGLSAWTSSEAQDPNMLVDSSDLSLCKVMLDDLARLACYDEAMDKFIPAQRNDDLVTIRKSDIERVKKESFGLSPATTLSTLDELVENSSASNSAKIVAKGTDRNRLKNSEPNADTPESDPSDKVLLTIAETETFGRDKTRFYFTNGQVWDQTDTITLRVPKLRKGKIVAAEIREAAFGSYLLRVNGKGRAIRVKRRR